MDAYWSTGLTSSYFGEFASARAPLEQGIALYDPQHHRSHAFLYGQDPGMFCLSYAAWTLWFLGYPDQALKKSHEALVLARELSHPHSLAIVLNHGAWVHHHRREEHGAKEQAEAAIALSTEHGFAQRVAVGTMLRGWALAEQEQGEEGIAQIRQGLTAYRATGAELMRPYFLALLTEAYGKMEQPEEGLTALAEALATVDKTGERWWEAELYRLKGELTLRQAGSRLQAVGGREKTEEAEECFVKAIEVAQKQQAKSLELRAVMSLARLWQQQGKRAEAHQLLSEIYNWFTEGFDTKDLQEAKALLDELN
jgi:predicted ATPase